MKLETTLTDFFTIIEKEHIERRLNRSEYSLNENQELDFMIINYNSLKKTKYSYLSDLPYARVLAGMNTDKPFDETTSHDALYKSIIITFIF